MPTCHITIAIINVYEIQLSVCFASNASSLSSADKSSDTILPGKEFTLDVFPAEFSETMPVAPNFRLERSKIYGICRGLRGTAVHSCNIDPFKQRHIPCKSQVNSLVLPNPAQNANDTPAPPFLASYGQLKPNRLATTITYRA